MSKTLKEHLKEVNESGRATRKACDAVIEREMPGAGFKAKTLVSEFVAGGGANICLLALAISADSAHEGHTVRATEAIMAVDAAMEALKIEAQGVKDTILAAVAARDLDDAKEKAKAGATEQPARSSGDC